MSTYSDIAREVATTLALNESSRDKGWHWRRGVVLFPEARCPYCKDVIKSRALWLVEGFYLRGQCVPVAGRELVLDTAWHPHCLPGNAICMGDAVDPLQALFNGLNPESAYGGNAGSGHNNFVQWLNSSLWSHSCDAMEREDEDDHEGEGYCESCEDYYDEDYIRNFNDSYYCESCFSRRAFDCAGCDGTYSIDDRRSTDDGDYCDDCWSERYFFCEGCEEDRSRDVSALDSLCKECATACEGCDKWFNLDDTGIRCSTCTETYCEDCCDDHTHEDNDA